MEGEALQGSARQASCPLGAFCPVGASLVSVCSVEFVKELRQGEWGAHPAGYLLGETKALEENNILGKGRGKGGGKERRKKKKRVDSLFGGKR